MPQRDDSSQCTVCAWRVHGWKFDEVYTASLMACTALHSLQRGFGHRQRLALPVGSRDALNASPKPSNVKLALEQTQIKRKRARDEQGRGLTNSNRVLEQLSVFNIVAAGLPCCCSFRLGTRRYS